MCYSIYCCSCEIIRLPRGMRCEFLPPYSPDFNPIELAFSAMKYLRRNGDYMRLAMTQMTDEQIYIALLRALYTITRQDTFGWYSHCGYVWCTYTYTLFVVLLLTWGVCLKCIHYIHFLPCVWTAMALKKRKKTGSNAKAASDSEVLVDVAATPSSDTAGKCFSDITTN